MTEKDKVKLISYILSNYRILKKREDILEKKIKYLKSNLNCEEAMNTTSFATTRAGSNVTDIVLKIVVREIEKIEKLEKEKKEIQTILEILDDAIDCLKGDEKKVIYLYYLSEVKLKWSDIACLLNYSEQYTKQKIRTNALLKIYKAIYGENNNIKILTNTSN